MIDICIVGCGASGMAAAIAAAKRNPSKRICILEKKEEEGKKLFATGNGRCNLTNMGCEGAAHTISFFKDLGILVREEEEGRVYPYSGRADSVVKAMVSELGRRAGINLEKESTVKGVGKTEAGFEISYEKGNQKKLLKAEKLLLATGGKAAPQYGTSGDGYVLARALGHEIIKMIPALAPIQCDGIFTGFKGIRARGRVSLLKDGVPVESQRGEIQFTEDGLSGICIFNLSRYIREPDVREARKNIDWQISIDFLPDISKEEIWEFLSEKLGHVEAAKELLNSVVSDGLAADIMEKASIKREGRADQITGEELDRLIMHLKYWKVRVTGVKGWKLAQCTSGGVALSQICMDTMESRLTPGLYFAGEIIDYDGPCGGYNLQNAWETGIKAGIAMAETVNVEM